MLRSAWNPHPEPDNMAARKPKTRTVVRWKPRSRRSGASPALKRANAQVINLRSRLRKVRSEGTGVKSVGKDWKTALKLGGAVNAGAALAGVTQALMPTVGPVDTRLAVGGGLMAVGAFFLKGDAAAMAVCAGAGMTAGLTQDTVQAALETTSAPEEG